MNNIPTAFNFLSALVEKFLGKSKGTDKIRAHLMENLRLYILEAPIKNLNHPLTKDIFYKIIQLKVEGFDMLRTKYLALDQNDFLATHFTLFRETNGSLETLMSIKMMSEDQANFWGIPFSASMIAEQIKSPNHEKAIKNFMNNCRRKKRKVSYPGSMTISPRVTEKTERKFILQVFQSLLTRYHISYFPSQSVAIARSKVRSIWFLKEMGYRELSLDGETLGEVEIPQYQNEPFHIVTVHNNFSSYAYEMVRKFQYIWDQRVEISADESNLPEKAAHPEKKSA